jgi:hypothetical protein
LPSPLKVFEMIITPEMEYPMVCVNVKQTYESDRFKLDLINMNTGASWFHSDEMEDMDGTGKIYFILVWIAIYFNINLGFSDSYSSQGKC